MNEEIINLTAKTLHIHKDQVKAVLNLLSEGATVPFIARYRKEVTGALNEDQIRAIAKEYDYALKLKERKEDVIRLIEEKGERLINYVYDLLENCPNDVRDYLQNHPFESN